MKLKDALAVLDDKYMLVDDAVNEAETAEADVGKAIRAERRAKKMSLRAFAARAEISPAYLSDIELGNRYPATDTLERIKKCLSSPK